MASDEKNGGRHSGEESGHGHPTKKTNSSPDWADGLRQLYESVVEEELPESFKVLLDQLDDHDPHKTGGTPPSAERGEN